MKKLFFKAEKTENERLDVFLAGAAEGLSRAHALKLIEAGNVKINGATELKGKRQATKLSLICPSRSLWS